MVTKGAFLISNPLIVEIDNLNIGRSCITNDECGINGECVSHFNP